MLRPALHPRPLSDRAEWAHLRCSFCGKDANHVRFLAAGVAGGKICDVCCWKALRIFLPAYLKRRPA
jgi:ClpX C4-type zinc finger protein